MPISRNEIRIDPFSRSLAVPSARPLPIPLVLLLLLCPAFGLRMAEADEGQSASIPTPWTGLWRVQADGVEGQPSLPPETGLVQIRPTMDGKGLELSRKMPLGSEIREILLPDGIERSIPSKECSGSQTYRWLPGPGVIVGHSVTNCPQSGRITTDSLKMFLSENQMLDILAIGSSGKPRLAVRRLFYEGAASSATPGVVESESSSAAISARIALSAEWTVQDIIQLARVVDATVLEAALFEKQSRLNPTVEVLKSLAQARVPGQVIDLLVALSYPDKFVVARNGQVALRAPVAPSSGPTWIPYPTSTIVYPGDFAYGCHYPFYGYSCWTYYSPFWWDYPIYLGPFDSTSGRPVPAARLTANTGYTQIQPIDTGRHAIPRWIGGSGASNQSSSPVDASSSSSASGSSSSSGSSNSSSSGASASPGGYSSGSSSSGTAVPRP